MKKMSQYTEKENMCMYVLRRIFCCNKRVIRYDEFMDNIEKLLDDETEKKHTSIQTEESTFGDEQNQEALDLGGGIKVQTI